MNRTLVQPKWIWPSVIAFSAMLAGTLSLANSSVWLRPLAGLWFLLVCPGMAFVGLLPVKEQGTRWTLAVALSLALDALVASFLIYANLWSPNTALVILIAASLTGAGLQVIAVKVPAGNWFQRRKNDALSLQPAPAGADVQRRLPLVVLEEKSIPQESSQQTILLINSAAPALLARHLQALGFSTVRSHSIEEAVGIISKLKYAVILVEVKVFNGNVWTALQQLRKRSTCPIIVRSEKLVETEIVRGFQSGADEYVTKSMAYARLAERLATLYSQSRQIHTAKGIVTSGDLKVDLTRKRVTTGGQTVELTENLYCILAFLARNANRTIPPNSLRAEIKELNDEISNRTIRRLIRSLRSKVEADPTRPRHIITRRGYGYRFE